MSAFTKRRALPGLLGGLMLMSALAHAGTVTYVYTDPQGTPLAEADASGNITATFDYAPYGSQALGTPPSGPGYTGHVNDPETGLVYMQARYYDPAVGRFISADPIGPGAGNPFNFNRYAYADNSPIVHDDPTGAYSRPVSDDDRDGGASDTGIEGNNAEDDGSGNLTNQGGNSAAAVVPAKSTDQQQHNLSSRVTSKDKIDINKIVATMDKNAHGSNTYNGFCAEACRKGLNAGGVTVPSTKGHYPNANQYGPVLLKNGASVVPTKGYVPQKGDIVVFEGGGPNHANGHIAIYDGKQWVSDTRQRQMAPDRSGYPGGHTVYRFPN